MAVEPRKSENFYAKDLIKIKMLKRSHWRVLGKIEKRTTSATCRGFVDQSADRDLASGSLNLSPILRSIPYKDLQNILGKPVRNRKPKIFISARDRNPLSFFLHRGPRTVTVRLMFKILFGEDSLPADRRWGVECGHVYYFIIPSCQPYTPLSFTLWSFANRPSKRHENFYVNGGVKRLPASYLWPSTIDPVGRVLKKNARRESRSRT